MLKHLQLKEPQQEHSETTKEDRCDTKEALLTYAVLPRPGSGGGAIAKLQTNPVPAICQKAWGDSQIKPKCEAAILSKNKTGKTENAPVNKRDTKRS